MSAFFWILTSTLLMSLIAWIGLILVAFNEETLQKFVQLLVAFTAGTLMAGAILHLIPEAVQRRGTTEGLLVWVLIGFTVFLLLEQLLHWNHEQRLSSDVKAPVTYLILVADGLHNFLGGLAIGGSFLVSPRVGIITWIIAAAHEIPQELGDFAILIHGGWEKRRALIINFISALTIVPGGILAWSMAGTIETILLLPFAAGNFLYIAASNLIPKIKHSETLAEDMVNLVMFILGLLVIYVSTLAVS